MTTRSHGHQEFDRLQFERVHSRWPSGVSGGLADRSFLGALK